MPQASLLQVLIVDDQRSMRSLVRNSLLELGCTKVVEAGDGVEALSRLAASPPHLIISDLNMPNLDGLGLLAKVRATPHLANIAFIMLTSRGEGEMVRKAIELKVNNYLVKPFALDGLRRKIEAVVGMLT
jgi:two-component system, chemotaxis family, chemotaxis protein CheY